MFKKCVAAYQNEGRYKDKIKGKAGVGIGVANGDMEIMYENQEYGFEE